ncbi:MAG: transglutaminase domain-containing protein [Planctomycetes bacterium]|nr:transglutaminase domain-containing protein [Planctomycetota bacterium]
MILHLDGLLLATALFSADANARPASDSLGETRVYAIQQTVSLSEIPAGAKSVRWWVSIPDNERHQDVLDFSVVDAPGAWRVERDAERGNRFLYVEVPAPKESSLAVVVEFKVRREPVLFTFDPATTGPITDVHRRLYAEEVRRDAPHMEVTPAIAAMADEVCGKDQNPATQALKLLQHVANVADHYSKDPTKPNCGIGDAAVCIEKGGGCCTDLHSLFIALARARGIPARLQMGYRVNPKNEGKTYDPGYRCWVEYFAPNHGWIPADIVEADAVDGLGPARWFTGLTERRVWLNEGREFRLRPAQASGPVNTMIIGHAEIDGVPARVLPEGDKKPQLARTIRFTEIR